MLEILGYVGYSLIGYSLIKLWKLNKTSVVIPLSNFRALENRIREDERSKLTINPTTTFEEVSEDIESIDNVIDININRENEGEEE